MVVGITGGIGSGKSTVAGLFEELANVIVYVADEEAKKLMNSSKSIKESIVREFGKEAYKEDVYKRQAFNIAQNRIDTRKREKNS